MEATASFTYGVQQYGTPALSAAESADDWTTEPFLVLAVTASPSYVAMRNSDARSRMNGVR